MSPDIAIAGLGIYLPPRVAVRDLALQAGGNFDDYTGWQRVRRTIASEHPAQMAAIALGRAIEDAGTSSLSLVVYAGVSRDYPPPWSVSADIQRRAQLGPDCIGLDVTSGCLATLLAMELAAGWLTRAGGGAAAVVCAERWNETIDYSDAGSRGLWGHSDGAGAVILTAGGEGHAWARYCGAGLARDDELNGFIGIQQGGTRHRLVTEWPYRRLSPRGSVGDLQLRYAVGYFTAVHRLIGRVGGRPAHIVCNQLSPAFVRDLPQNIGHPDAVVVTTGTDDGHMGGSDVIRGLHQLRSKGVLRQDVLVAASATHAFGAALLKPMQLCA